MHFKRVKASLKQKTWLRQSHVISARTVLEASDAASTSLFPTIHFIS